MKTTIKITLLIATFVCLSWQTSLAQKTVALKSYFEKYVCTDKNINNQLVADRKIAQEWETFTLIEMPNGKVALKAHNGKYVTVSNENDGQLSAKSVKAGDPEQFSLIKVNDEWIGLKAFNGKYVCADNKKKGMLFANRTSIGEWESFMLVVLKDDSKPVENKTITIKGKVLNAKTKAPVKAEITTEDMISGNTLSKVESDASTGNYQVSIPAGGKVAFHAEASNFIPVYENVNSAEVTGSINRDLLLVPMTVGETVKLNNIFFQTGKSTLTSDSYGELDKVVLLFKSYPNLEIEVAGHTDNVGSNDVNTKLSLARANAVKDYLTSEGVAVNKIKTKGYGESKPVATNDTDEGRTQNRRVEFTILKK